MYEISLCICRCFLSKATNVAVRIYVYIYEIQKCELKQSSHFKLLLKMKLFGLWSSWQWIFLMFDLKYLFLLLFYKTNNFVTAT